jgi:HAD superfamily hydrolase (TIGR01509 family)
VRREVPLAIASNKPAYLSVRLLETLGILDRFEIVAGPDDEIPPKPDPTMIFEILESLGLEPSEALLVGDMPIDVETARAAGLSVAVLPTGSSSPSELTAAEPDFLFDRLVEVLGLF